MPLSTISPVDASASTREFVDLVTDESDWREAYYYSDHASADDSPPCGPTDYCGRCRPCHVLAFLTKAWQHPKPGVPGAKNIDIAA